jgi:hypothetical protein
MSHKLFYIRHFTSFYVIPATLLPTTQSKNWEASKIVAANKPAASDDESDVVAAQSFAGDDDESVVGPVRLTNVAPAFSTAPADWFATTTGSTNVAPNANERYASEYTTTSP